MDAVMWMAVMLWLVWELGLLWLVWHLSQQAAGRWAIIEALHAENNLAWAAIESLKAERATCPGCGKTDIRIGCLDCGYYKPPTPARASAGE